jgi:hypothetical protein
MCICSIRYLLGMEQQLSLTDSVRLSIRLMRLFFCLLISILELLPHQFWLSKRTEYGTEYFPGQKEVSCMYFAGNSSYYDLRKLCHVLSEDWHQYVMSFLNFI